jgi:protein NrfD
VSATFFLFLLHASLGLLAMLPWVPRAAGVKFFKLCAAAAAFMTASGVGLLYRRFGLEGGGWPNAPGGADYPALLALSGAVLALTLFYNRAEHFGWPRLRSGALAGALSAGLGCVVLGAPAGARTLVVATDVTSIWLLGASASAMILGHFYLVTLDLPISALRRLTLLLVLGLGLRLAIVVFALAGPVHGGLDEAGRVAAGLFSPDGIFVWMRLLFGIAGPLSLIWFIWKTVEIRSTQSATGILYVQLFLVMSGELLAKHLRVTAGLPL